MIYINGVSITEDTNLLAVEQKVKTYLHEEKLVLVNNSDQAINEEELSDLLNEKSGDLHLHAVKISYFLSGFQEELRIYINNVEDYINKIRESEDFSSVSSGFIQIVQSIIELSSVSNYLNKDLLNQNDIMELSKKALEQAEYGNEEYILDLIEYELLPLLNNLFDEIDKEL